MHCLRNMRKTNILFFIFTNAILLPAYISSLSPSSTLQPSNLPSLIEDLTIIKLILTSIETRFYHVSLLSNPCLIYSLS